jgi:hypothetical protein
MRSNAQDQVGPIRLEEIRAVDRTVGPEASPLNLIDRALCTNGLMKQTDVPLYCSVLARHSHLCQCRVN